jgi:hypothetical protein
VGRGVPALGSTAIRRQPPNQHQTIMAEPTKRKKWSDVKARLEALDQKGVLRQNLVTVVGERPAPTGGACVVCHER